MSHTPKKISRLESTQEIMNASLAHPYTWYPIVFGVGTGFLLFLFNSSLLSLFSILGGLTLGGFGFLVNFIWRREQLIKIFLKRAHEDMEKHKVLIQSSLKTELRKIPNTSDTEKFVGQANYQFQESERQFQHFLEILGKKLSPSELTYQRYHNIAEQVFLSILDNLQSVSDTFTSIQSIDLPYIEKRLKTLGDEPKKNDAATIEIESLKERMKLRADQINHIDLILSQNEKALTSLSNASVNLGRVNTGTESKASMEFGEAIEELKRLSDRAHQYGTPSVSPTPSPSSGK